MTDDASPAVARLVDDAVSACASGAEATLAERVAALAEVATAGGAAVVDGALARSLVDAVADTWRRGWQPADLPRAGERMLGRAQGRLLARAVARAAGEYPPGAMPGRWQAQIDGLEVDQRPAAPFRAAGGWVLPGGRGAVEPSRAAPVLVAVEALALLRRLPRLPLLGPLPGEAGALTGDRVGGERSVADARTIARVAALLAKAESTEFPDEAESLTAKAQELMTRHAIDRASLDARDARPGSSRVGGRRVGVDDPYAGAKAMLLDAVASANRCRAVWSKQFGFATVFGDEGDLDAVEVLFTSLLVQSARALVAEARPRAAGGPSAGRTRSFRQSFLVAFASRVGARLRAAADAVATSEAERTPSLLPVLAARRDAADAACAAGFPQVRTTTMSANDAAGWLAGEQAADRAHLDVHRAVVRHGRSLVP